MNNDDITPLSVGDEDTPFTGPNPSEDEQVSTTPGTDSEIDQQEYYDEGLAGAAELEKNPDDIDEDDQMPDGFHVE